jgi:hypothetical protein
LCRYSKGSRKAVLLRLDQDTSSPGFVKSMGAERAVTLIAVAKSDSFDEVGRCTLTPPDPYGPVAERRLVSTLVPIK